jgi:hypothetical protein
MSGHTGYKFIIRTNKPLSQKEQELQLADIRSHVIRNTLHSSRRQHLQFVSCNRPPINENQQVSSESVVNKCGTKEVTKDVVESQDPPSETRSFGAIPSANTKLRPNPDGESTEIVVYNSESESGRRNPSPWHWCKGARADLFNIVPSAAGAAYELDLGMRAKRSLWLLTDIPQ